MRDGDRRKRGKGEEGSREEGDGTEGSRGAKEVKFLVTNWSLSKSGLPP